MKDIDLFYRIVIASQLVQQVRSVVQMYDSVSGIELSVEYFEALVKQSTVILQESLVWNDQYQCRYGISLDVYETDEGNVVDVVSHFSMKKSDGDDVVQLFVDYLCGAGAVLAEFQVDESSGELREKLLEVCDFWHNNKPVVMMQRDYMLLIMRLLHILRLSN